MSHRTGETTSSRGGRRPGRARTGATAIAVVGILVSGCAYIERVSVEGFADPDSPYRGYLGANPTISADGRYVAFDSAAPNLVPGDTNSSNDVFVRDLATGTTERVSVSSAGAQANGVSIAPSISGDGRYVAFQSDASTLVPGDTNNRWDVFVRDRATGTTERVSVDSAGNQGNNHSVAPSISADGRYVAFESFASDLVAGDTNGRPDIFVHDRVTGTTERVNVSSTGAQSNHVSEAPSISGDGRYVAFESMASNLVPGDTNSTWDVFVRDRVAGTTARVSVSSANAQANGPSQRASISADGRYVAFDSGASNLVPGDTNIRRDVFVRDRVSGTTERVSVDATGEEADGNSSAPSLNADARFVAFSSDATNLVPGDTNDQRDIFVRDRAAGTTTRVSVDTAGGQADESSDRPAISADGRYVAFDSRATNLVAEDLGDPRRNVFVRANPVPWVTGVSPAEVARGATTTVTVTGENFAADAQVLVTNPGTGVAVVDVEVVSPTEISVEVQVDADAPTVARKVWVVHPGTGPGTGASTFGLCDDCLTVT